MHHHRPCYLPRTYLGSLFRKRAVNSLTQCTQDRAQGFTHNQKFPSTFSSKDLTHIKPPSLFSLLIQHVLGMAALVYHFIQHLVWNWGESGVFSALLTLFRSRGVAWFEKPFRFCLVVERVMHMGSIVFASFSFEFNLDIRVLRNIFEVVTCCVLYRWLHLSAFAQQFWLRHFLFLGFNHLRSRQTFAEEDIWTLLSPNSHDCCKCREFDTRLVSLVYLSVQLHICQMFCWTMGVAALSRQCHFHPCTSCTTDDSVV